MNQTLLEVQNIKKYFPLPSKLFSKKKEFVKAVDGVSFTVNKGETLSIVGESGCGKSTTGRMIMKLLDITEGKVIFEGQDITDMTDDQIRPLRKEFQMVFQDPYASLNPRLTIKETLEEPLIVHNVNKSNRSQRVTELLEVVGLNKYHADRYPHEFSGGQRQRIGIARALAVNPKLIIADEPVSALDVSIQSQVLNLLKDLQEEFGLTYVFIAHDLSVVEHISDRVGVMYLGRLVELATRDELFGRPLHPYTKALLSAVPIPDPTVKRERIILKGDIPSPANPPSGCTFHTRCPFAQETCKIQVPEFRELETGHYVACHYAEELEIN
ncbi:ABC transporter ATP-binding protein [Sporosarcina gallistercoris]|uniref:Dipeptide ABC transporter ATP-binding protein n=1 Tax=Sporosarcina gallistercoris TaxID=2762245 RepID=A0ABR8PLJ3_9BACL|nr:dipeptide ABC transporter ATP-binding protein [Sporosarcina gallistercoris]MBD7909043.1 dipeptide ABC transporter ATP-binding protein [Sporosarcina gallistercoris]